MSIRIQPGTFSVRKTEYSSPPQVEYAIDAANGRAIWRADTEEEITQVRRALENLLAPRFTRDQAIAVVKKEQLISFAVEERQHFENQEKREAFLLGVRLTLEALAAAGVFLPDDKGEGCADCTSRHACHRHAASVGQTMADKLDAAGLK